MTIGFDYNGTITKDERYFKKLAILYMSIGVQVYIISALKNPVDLVKKKAVMKCRIPCTGIRIVTFKDYTEIPGIKLQMCKELGVTHMYDDMDIVCEKLSKAGIVTFQVR